VVGVLYLLVCYLSPSYHRITAKSNQMKGGSNARQIIGLMMTYASDNEGHYPDHGKDLSKLTANAALRTLVQEGLVQDESIFGCPGSRFMGDKNLGEAPDYAQALEAGENHWMMIANQSNTTPAHYPVLLENGADVSWPPRWLPETSYVARRFAEWTGEHPPRGRSWEKGTILVGFNDASIQTVKLELQDGLLALPESVLKPEGKEPLPELRILDVE
jgi:hypothetical protein